MDDKRIIEILNEITRTDQELQYNSTAYDIDSLTEIFKKANTIQPVHNSLNVNEALLIMLQVVHSFKYSIDMYWDHIDDDGSDEKNKGIKDIINHRVTEVKKKPFKIDYGQLVTLLLEILYEINGAHYRTRDTDYALEDELDEILKLPNWSNELDSAITQFLLLPLYNATHQNLDEKN